LSRSRAAKRFPQVEREARFRVDPPGVSEPENETSGLYGYLQLN
jgi:hypothetical protein